MFENGKPLINDDPIVSLQNHLGIKFPASYLEIVRVNDGAQADPYGVQVFSRDRQRATFIEWNQLIAFVRDDKPGLSIAGFNSKGRTPHRPEGLVAFALDGGGYLFCFP